MRLHQPVAHKRNGPGAKSRTAVQPLSVDDLANLRRRLTALLASFGGVNVPQGEGIRSRINRLSQDGGPIPKDIAAMMVVITEMRNSMEYRSKVISDTECAVVRLAWQAIQERGQNAPKK